MHISSDDVFINILKKPSIVQEQMIPHMKANVIFVGKKQKKKKFEKPNNQKPNTKKMSFSSSTNIQFTIWEQFLQFKACKSAQINAIGIEVAQQIKSSGCPTKRPSYY